MSAINEIYQENNPMRVVIAFEDWPRQYAVVVAGPILCMEDQADQIVDQIKRENPGIEDVRVYMPQIVSFLAAKHLTLAQNL